MPVPKETQNEDKKESESKEAETDDKNTAESVSLKAKQTELEDKKNAEKKAKETELEKYWKPVRENPSDFTGWTYLLQYVEQEVCLVVVNFKIIFVLH